MTMAGDGTRPEERATGLMMMLMMLMMLHFKIIMIRQPPPAFAVATKTGVLLVQGVMFVQVQTGLAVGIIEAVVEVMIIIGVAMITIINNNNNEGGEKVDVVDVVDVEKEDGEATDVVIVLAVEKNDHGGGTMIIHGVDHSIEKNLGGKDAVLVEEASAVVPQ
jgi:hypothetical protein